jgi:3-hydroxyisobutyrate dehydrogenase-like beta-hydroxyacid dehydrogenase
VAKLGWIGLGDMGAPMARRLLAAGHTLGVWARHPARSSALCAAGAEAAASPRELAERSEAIFLCVTDGPAVDDIVFGADGIAAGLARGTLVIDHSTIDPPTTRRGAERLQAQGAGWVDAPVSGGTAGAAAGTLACFLGGSDADVACARPWIAAYAENITHMGPSGAGQIAKSCNQAVVGATIAMWVETLAYARRCGLDPALLVDALAGGWADSAIRQAHGHALAEGRFAPARGNLLLKDLEIVGELARASGSPMPVTAIVTTLYRLLAAQGHAPGGATALVQLYEAERPSGD